MSKPESGREAEEKIRRPLYRWFRAVGRDLPWRRTRDPYAILVSEFMLQQTTVAAVIPYFERWMTRFPTVTALAAAGEQDVLGLWQGLGYYSRARNLHKCAVVVATELGGKFPSTVPELQKLPGIGPYTANAIAAIAFGEAATPVDGNVERVVARLFAVKQPLPAAKTELKRLAASLTPQRRAGDFAQAMMDLGAGICTPKRPSCLVCPVQQDCAASAHGIAEQLPMRLERAERPQRVGYAFVALREDGHVLLRKRAEAGLLGGMLEVPGTHWGDLLPPAKEALRTAPVRADWWAVPGTVVHVFTHFRLEVVVYRALVPNDATLNFWAEPERCRWVARRDLHGAAIPSVMRKIIAHALSET